MTLQADELVLPHAQPEGIWKEVAKRNAVSTRFVDFWLLGGASILLWAILCIAQRFRNGSEIVESRFLQMGAVFSIMTLFCNHPHFIISYRFGYGRGVGFILKNWISLILVPFALLLLYAVAYFKFNTQVGEWSSVKAVNSVIGKTGLSFRFGTLSNFGTEVLSLSVLLMNLTVGWHYSKQVFGCVMTYARFDSYPIGRVQRILIKASLFSVAFFNFFYLSIYAPEYNTGAVKEAYFFNIPLVPLGIPAFVIPLSAVLCAVLAVATLIAVFYVNFRKHGKWPSPNLVVAWVAFYVWWIPVIRQTEFYILAIPFFHSLQYLPFAFRIEESGITAGRGRDLSVSIRLAVLLLIGFAAFELVPNLLDQWLGTHWFFDTWFFMIAIAVFINIHHFFIDSVVWRFDQGEVKRGIFGE